MNAGLRRAIELELLPKVLGFCKKGVVDTTALFFAIPGGNAVLFDTSGKKPTRLELPEDLVDRKKEKDFVAELPELPLEFYVRWSLPSVAWLELHLEISSDAYDEAVELLAERLQKLEPKSSATQLGGWPENIDEDIGPKSTQCLLFQIDGETPGPPRLRAAFTGDSLLAYMLDPKDLAAGNLAKAKGELVFR